MKEELAVTFEIPDRFINLNDKGEYHIPEDFPYNKVVDFIKDFSMKYYGIEVDVEEKDLVPKQSRAVPSKWSITHKWVDEPNYSGMYTMLYELSNFGPKNDTLSSPPRKKSYYSLIDYQNLQEIIKNMHYKKISRKDILKNMFKSIKNHLQMLK